MFFGLAVMGIVGLFESAKRRWLFHVVWYAVFIIIASQVSGYLMAVDYLQGLP